jgi:Insertion element 4 transposase N-terminal
MQLSEFTLTAASVEPEEVFKALATVIPPETISQAIETTQSQAERTRRLPTELVISVVMAMSLWSNDSIVDVLKNLADGWSNQLIRLGQRWSTPSKSSISEARQRVGPGAFLNGLRLMAIE